MRVLLRPQCDPGLLLVPQLFHKRVGPFGLDIWNRELVAEIEIIPLPFLLLYKMADSDLPLIEVGHILCKKGVRDKKQGICFDRIY